MKENNNNLEGKKIDTSKTRAESKKSQAKVDTKKMSSNGTKVKESIGTAQKIKARMVQTEEAVMELFTAEQKEGLDECELLKEVYKNAKMAMDAIEAIRPFTEEKSLKNMFNRQLRGYSSLTKEIEEKAEKSSFDLKSTNIFSKAMLWSGVMMNTIMDKSVSKLAEIMIQGINMGIISITKALNNTAEGVNTSFAEKLNVLYNTNIEALKIML